MSKPYKELLSRIDTAQQMHFRRKQLKIEEDPWDNYLFYDAQRLMSLLCHSQPLQIAEQVILARFIAHTLDSETISQYRVQGQNIIKELFAFARSFDGANSEIDHDDEIIDSEDEGSG